MLDPRIPAVAYGYGGQASPTVTGEATSEAWWTTDGRLFNLFSHHSKHVQG